MMRSGFAVLLCLLFVTSQAIRAEAPDVEVGYTAIPVSPPEGNTTIPWRVFAESAEFRAVPLLSADPIDTIPTGSEFTGELVATEPDGLEWIAAPDEDRTVFVSRSAVHRVHPNNTLSGDLPYGSELINRWWGIPLEYEPTDLVKLPAEWTGDRGYRMRKDAADAMVRMFEAARADGIELRVISGYRSGPTQVRIYTRNIGKDGPNQRYSAPPGHSEHQLGTTADITDAAREHNFDRKFDEKPEGAWLMKNAHRFGFLRSYSPDNVDETGYISEPWHWRYWGDAMAEEQARRAAQ